MRDLFAPIETKAPVLEPWKPHSLTHEQWPPNYAAVYAWRIETLSRMRANPALLASAKAYYAQPTKAAEFIMHWIDTYDPRKEPLSNDPEKRGPKWMPFVFFKRQAEFVWFLHQCRLQSANGLVEKARDMGATWLACAYSIWSWLFIPSDSIGWGSRKQELVDRLGEPDSIFEKMRLILRRLPPEFLPVGFNFDKHATHMKFINPENGSTISGEAGDNIGRGGRKSMYFKDEAQPLNAGVLTPSGWQTMRDMTVGSRVIGSNGKSCSVTHINDVGIAPVYRVDFSDGTSVECSENHLWTVEKKIGKSKKLTLRTSELMSSFQYVSPGKQVQYRYKIPVIKAVEFDVAQTLPLHPWIVGALLGDGKVGNGCAVFTTNDSENVVRFAQYCPEGTKLSFDGKYSWRFVDSGNRYNKSSRARNAVIAAEIYGHRSEDKFIPDMYKFASVVDRIHLLQGLMDTDGSASGGVASYHTCSEQLANDVRFVVQSLGGTATINVKRDHRGYRDMYVLHIFIPNIVPFALRRKVEKLCKRSHSCDKTIVNIEYVRDDVVRCITVDNADGLYVTDHCILTHNSAHYERPEKIEAALGDNTNVQIDISSVNGLGNVFHRRREAGIMWTPSGTYEAGYTRVFIIDWRDHPLKTEEWYERRRAKHEREGMIHVFEQETNRNYSAAISNTIIPAAWIDAAVDAHKIIPQLVAVERIPDIWIAGLDVADDGIDRNGLCKRQWIICRDVEEWGERDPGVSTRRTVAACRVHKHIKIQYDSIGIGAAVKSEYNRLVDDKLIDPSSFRFVAWNAGAGVQEPYERIIPNDNDSLCNEDFFENMKAQAWWSARTRFYKTWVCVTAVKAGQPVPNYDPDELVSLDGSMPLLSQLKKELAQPVHKKSSRLKTMVDKKPDGTKSPNLGDAFVMAFFPAIDDYSQVLVGTMR